MWALRRSNDNWLEVRQWKCAQSRWVLVLLFERRRRILVTLFGRTGLVDGMVVNVCRHGHGKFLALLLFCNGQKYLAETLRLIQKIPHSFFLQNVCSKVLKIGGYFFVKRMTLQTLWPILQNKVSTKKSERWKKKQNLLSKFQDMYKQE